MKNKKKNKFTKGKTLGIVAASLATVALVGVGYSSWVIGVQNTTINRGVGVEVDTSSDNSVDFTAKIAETDKLIFKEANTSGEDDFVKITGNTDTGLPKLSVTLTNIKVIQAAGNITKYTKINVVLATSGNDFMKVASDNIHLDEAQKDGTTVTTDPRDTAPAGGYTYFDLTTTEIELSASTTSTNEGAKVKTTTYADQTIIFNWGSFFKEGTNVSAPSVYYNQFFNVTKPELDRSAFNADLVNQELAAMSTALTNKTVRLVLTLAE